MLATRVEPHRTQARQLRPGNIIAGVIAHMHRRTRRHATAQQGFVKQARIRLGDTDVFGAQHKFEVMPQADSPHIRVAIGDHAQGVIPGQRNQGWLSLRE